eukprot:2728505-Pyramimonas_sp.AAC.1
MASGAELDRSTRVMYSGVRSACFSTFHAVRNTTTSASHARCTIACEDIPGAGTNQRRDGRIYPGREPIGGGMGAEERFEWGVTELVATGGRDRRMYPERKPIGGGTGGYTWGGNQLEEGREDIPRAGSNRRRDGCRGAVRMGSKSSSLFITRRVENLDPRRNRRRWNPTARNRRNSDSDNRRSLRVWTCSWESFTFC